MRKFILHDNNFFCELFHYIVITEIIFMQIITGLEKQTLTILQTNSGMVAIKMPVTIQ